MVDRKSISGKKRSMIAERQNWICVFKRLGDKEPCGKYLRIVGFEVDHHVALIHEGSNDNDNLRAICIPCHKIKTKLDIQANAKIKRLTRTKPKLKKRIPSRPMASTAKKVWPKRAFGKAER